MAENRMFEPDDASQRAPRETGVQHIRDVLAELLTQYEVRFPGIHVTMVEESSYAA